MNNIETHVVSTPNKTALTVAGLRQELKDDYTKQVTNYFGGDKRKGLKFMSAVMYSVQKTPGLLECSKESIMQSFMSCAEFGLYPSGVSGEAFVLPYNSKNGKVAQFQLGYQGIITLLWRGGNKVSSQIVRKSDMFDYEEGLEPKLVHKFNVFGDRGEPIGVYAIAELPDGRKLFKVMSRDEIMKFKGFSKAGNSTFSPWNSGQDPELWMWQKTCIKQLAKTLPKTEELQLALSKDNEDSVVSDNRANLDAAGPAVGAPSHKPEEGAQPPADDDLPVIQQDDEAMSPADEALAATLAKEEADEKSRKRT